MIFAFTGKTGTGKTNNMVKAAHAQWKRGVDIYSNTILFFGQSRESVKTNPKNFFFLYRFYEFLREQFFLILRKPYVPFRRGRIVYFENLTEIVDARNGLILFDEAQVLFNSRNWEALPDEFQYKLQQHRKHRLDMYCTTQNMGSIDIVYRRLVQVWYHHETVFKFGESPVFLALFRRRQKDVDYLYNSVDDLQVPDIRVSYFFIHKFSRVLYDTLYDVGFKRFKTLWLSLGSKRKMFWIIPKRMSLNNARKELLSVKYCFSQNK